MYSPVCILHYSSAGNSVPFIGKQSHFKFAYFSPFFFSYLFGIEMINTFIHTHSSVENHTRSKLDQKGQSVCPFLDQKGSKTLPFWGGTYLCDLYISLQEYPTTLRQSCVILKIGGAFSISRT